MPRTHKILGSVPQHYKRKQNKKLQKIGTKEIFPIKEELVYKGDFTPTDSGWKPTTIYAIAVVSVCYCVSLKSSVTVFLLIN